jgi:hypothetical protein
MPGVGDGPGSSWYPAPQAGQPALVGTPQWVDEQGDVSICSVTGLQVSS